MKGIKDLYTVFFLNHLFMTILINSKSGPRLLVSHTKSLQCLGWDSGHYPLICGFSLPPVHPRLLIMFPSLDSLLSGGTCSSDSTGDGRMGAGSNKRGLIQEFSDYRNIYKYTLFQGTVIQLISRAEKSKLSRGLNGVAL